jgi:hypothetical protein
MLGISLLNSSDAFNALVPATSVIIAIVKYDGPVKTPNDLSA